ncbi:pectate lyase-like adhesive domain-containing protein [Paenibacillus nasutitermitis]|uniref:Uncharacterized protein n=1 Tax=Paenibacillus nasutitermitis TaxID=1652958 RepID=A0A917E1Q8_9BACL|nr:pectate lyase-like adhesive domain-containing protein [Paenibacillus nasutitermitis]GGD91036.1 hypothetical protein GCM10010911_57170 [Paenibacillus nasutitermitis]
MAKKKHEDKRSSARSKVAKVMAVTMAVTPVVAVLPGVVSAAEANEASVSTLFELQTALGDSLVTTINLTADISGVAERLVVTRALTINGNGHTISYTDAINESPSGSKHGIAVEASGVTINDLHVAMTEAPGWQGVYALQVYNATGVTVNNYTGSGADAALLVNASEVNLTGVTTVTDNDFGGIEVARGVDGIADAQLTVTGTLVNGSEAADKPTIWIVDGQGSVTNSGATATVSTPAAEGKTYYYLAKTASAEDLTELQTALGDVRVTTINLTANIGSVAERLVVNRALTINGNGHTINFTDAINSSSPGSRHGIAVEASGVTINDLHVAMTAKLGWQGVYALQVYNSAGVTVNNFTGSGADAALLVNASKVNLTGVTTVTGNDYGGIEVAKGPDGINDAQLTVSGTLVNDSEAIDKPTIWIVGDEGSVTNTGATATVSTPAAEGKTYFYLAKTASAKNLTELQTALGDIQVTTINLTDDISGVAERLVVNRALTINGNGHTISYTDAINESPSGSKHGIAVEASGVTINDLKVAMTAKLGWQGVYALQVYNSAGVTVNNFTGSGADAALLVNASEVNLTGVTTVTGNDYGGIEVAKGPDGINNAQLTVTGTLVNGSEAADKPTIWVVNGQGTVTNTGLTPTTDKPAEGGKTYYYLVPAPGTSDDYSIDTPQVTVDGLSASVVAKINKQSVTDETVTVIFQLMNGNKPVQLIAIEENISDDEEVRAEFELPTTGNYTVKVFVWDDLQNQAAKAQPKEAAIASNEG